MAVFDKAAKFLWDKPGLMGKNCPNARPSATNFLAMNGGIEKLGES